MGRKGNMQTWNFKSQNTEISYLDVRLVLMHEAISQRKHLINIYTQTTFYTSITLMIILCVHHIALCNNNVKSLVISIQIKRYAFLGNKLIDLAAKKTGSIVVILVVHLCKLAPSTLSFKSQMLVSALKPVGMLSEKRLGQDMDIFRESRPHL